MSALALGADKPHDADMAPDGRAMRVRSPYEIALGAQFEEYLKTCPPSEIAARRAAFTAFMARGVPTKALESWHYTDMRRALREALPLARQDGAGEGDAVRAAVYAHCAQTDAPVLVTVNGHFCSALSSPLPKGVRVKALEMLDHDALTAPFADLALVDDPMVLLNAAMMDGALEIAVAPDVEPEMSLHILHLSTGAPSSAHGRVMLHVGAGAKFCLHEHFMPADATTATAFQRTGTSLITLEAGAVFYHTRFVAEGEGAVHVSTTLASVADNCVYVSCVLGVNTGFFRNQHGVRFAGSGARCALRGLSLLRHAQTGDNTLVIEHAVPGCESRETFRHILMDEAVGTYQGKVIVRPGAQKTDGAMKSQALLLSNHATMNNKPELEIYADDVVCGHGATCGALDEDAVFYLQARGLPRKDAQALLLNAFARAILDDIPQEDVRLMGDACLQTWLAQR